MLITIFTVLLILVVDGYFSLIKIPFTDRYLSCRLPYGVIKIGFNAQTGVECCPGLVTALDSMSYKKCYLPWDKNTPQTSPLEEPILYENKSITR